MADKKITQLQEANLPLQGGEKLAIVQDGVTKKVSADQLGGGGGDNIYNADGTIDSERNVTVSESLFIKAPTDEVGKELKLNFKENEIYIQSFDDNGNYLNLNVSSADILSDGMTFSIDGQNKVYRLKISDELAINMTDTGNDKGLFISRYDVETLGLLIKDEIDQKGLVGAEDFSANYDDLTYVQKKYVDENSGESLWERSTGANSLVPKNSGSVASGDNSIAEGFNTEAKAPYSRAGGRSTLVENNAEGGIAEGEDTITRGKGARSGGIESEANGDSSVADGDNVIAQSYGEMVVGAYNKLDASFNPTVSLPEDKAFSVGVGQFGDEKNGLVIRKNGVITADELTQDQYDAEPTGKVLVTKEVLERQSKSIDETVTGFYNIDWSVASNWDLTLTGNTTLTQSNIPKIETEKTITIYVIGDFALTLPNEWLVTNINQYDGLSGSQIVVQGWNNGSFNANVNNVSKPNLYIVEPSIARVDTTFNVILTGLNFTPNTTVSISGQTVNNVEFVTPTQLKVNITTGSSEGLNNITINNGFSRVFTDVFETTLGDVFVPTITDWENTNLVADVSTESQFKTNQFGSVASGAWIKEFDITKDFEIRFRAKRSSLGDYEGGNNFGTTDFSLINASDDSLFISGQFYYNAVQAGASYRGSVGSPTDNNLVFASFGLIGTFDEKWSIIENFDFRLKFLGGVLYSYNGNTLLNTITDVPTENLKLKFDVKFYDYQNIKYIEFN